MNPVASPGYATGRLEHAVRTLVTHPDPAVRGRAAEKAQRWQGVLHGMATGALQVGSRTPVAGVPAWVTLEVAQGGFATGRLVAEGPLSPEEEAMQAGLPESVPGETPRARLNAWYLGDAGQRALLEALAEGRVAVDVPEASALLVVAWLLAHGHEEAALDVVAELAPWMARLRLHPRITERPAPAGALVHLRSGADVAGALRARRTPAALVTMNAAITVWAPLYDALVALWLETVDGPTPRLAGDVVVGGWPGQCRPPGWDARRAAWLTRYAEARAAHPGTGKHTRPKSNFTWLRAGLEDDPPTPQALGWVRRALANTLTCHGAPGSGRRRELRARQQAEAARPEHVRFARILADRLEVHAGPAGLPSEALVTGPVAAAEASEGVPEGARLPPYLAAKVAPALEAPVEELVARRIIRSAEVLARVLPQLTAGVVAAGVADPDLRRAFALTYAAFRRRRSLLLLSYASQVPVEALPWVAALAPLRQATAAARAGARATAEEALLLAQGAFPATLLPNPFVRELGAVLRAAEVDVPLLEELAADIFMGGFTPKWVKAAQLTAEVLKGSLYARYYDLPPPEALTATSPEEAARRFGELCYARAGQAPGQGWRSTGQNGAVLEQSQILTTHNLAPLVFGLGLQGRLHPERHARDALAGVLRCWRRPRADWRTTLRLLKDGAYAWRQAIFYMSLAPEAQQVELLDELDARVATLLEARAARFAPVALGLRHVMAGGALDAAGTGGGGRRYLGWVTGAHWLAG
jgi:hypothetical protein